jgi:hypothetical protein
LEQSHYNNILAYTKTALSLEFGRCLFYFRF